jgi:hypothetical protein
LITGNSVIVKPHPKAIYPIAIVVAEIQKALKDKGLDPLTVQLAADATGKLITKELCEHPLVKVIDYTGGSAFGAYVESLAGQSSFHRKAGVILLSLTLWLTLLLWCKTWRSAVSLYSGQMCTAPQNIFIPADGIASAGGHIAYADIVNAFERWCSRQSQFQS